MYKVQEWSPEGPWGESSALKEQSVLRSSVLDHSLDDDVFQQDSAARARSGRCGRGWGVGALISSIPIRTKGRKGELDRHGVSELSSLLSSTILVGFFSSSCFIILISFLLFSYVSRVLLL